VSIQKIFLKKGRKGIPDHSKILISSREGGVCRPSAVEGMRSSRTTINGTTTDSSADSKRSGSSKKKNLVQRKECPQTPIKAGPSN